MTTSQLPADRGTATITILGCGTSTGVPMVGCGCRVCSSNDPRDKRTRASALLRNGERTILIDTSPDLRQQALREKVMGIDAVLFTHSHADHVNGIDDLRGFHFMHHQVIPCFAEQTTLDILLKRFCYIFEEQAGTGYTPLLEPHVIAGEIPISGLKILPLPLQHGNTISIGYRIGNAAYLTDCNSITPAALQLLEGVEIMVIDGLRWNPHPTHFNIETAIAAARQLNPKRIVLTHLSHDVLYADGEKLPPGVEFAYDGMELTLDTEIK